MRNSLQSSYQMVVVITEMGAEPPFYYSDDGEKKKKNSPDLPSHQAIPNVHFYYYSTFQ